MRVERESDRQFGPAIIISLAIHIVVFVLLIFGDRWIPTIMKTGDRDDLPKRDEPYIVADILPPEFENRPKDAKFIGKYDSSVLEETVARDTGRDVHRSRSADTEGQGAARREELKSKNIFAFGDMYRPKLDTDNLKDGRGKIPLEDFYPDYKRGEHTYLNVLRYPNVDYFVHMKRKFKLTFNPGPALRDAFAINQVMRGVAEVVLGVTVDSNGNLKELFIFRESGIPEYDNEAMRTVRASSPFSNPPKEFLEDGLLRMCWTFTTYL